MLRDFRYALRSIRKNPGFSLAAILTLALGIGANSAIFSLIHGVLLEPLPYRDGDDLVVLRQSTVDIENVPFSIAEFFDYRDQSRQMQLVEYHSMSFTLLGQGEPQRVSTGVVSHDFFDVLGVTPSHGRFFAESDEAHGAEAVLILSHGYWQKQFGGDPGIHNGAAMPDQQPEVGGLGRSKRHRQSKQKMTHFLRRFSERKSRLAAADEKRHHSAGDAWPEVAFSLDCTLSTHRE